MWRRQQRARSVLRCLPITAYGMPAAVVLCHAASVSSWVTDEAVRVSCLGARRVGVRVSGCGSLATTRSL